MGKQAAVRLLCVLAFMAVCLGAFYFFSVFLSPGHYTLGYPEDRRWEIVDPSGGVRPFDPASAPDGLTLPEGAYCRMTGRMPKAEDLPDLYEDGYISCIPLDAEMTVYVDGVQVIRCACASASFIDARVDVDPAWAGTELVAEYRSTAPGFFPLPPSFYNVRTDTRIVAATSNLYSIPAGALLALFILATAIFFIGLDAGSPDWSLICLALMSLFTAFWNMNAGQGYNFMPTERYMLLQGRWFLLILLGLLAVYLSLRKHRAWRRFGAMFLISLSLAAVLYILLRLADAGFALNIEYFLAAPFQMPGVLSLIIGGLVAICGGIAVLDMVRSRLAAISQARALSVRQDMLQNSYRDMERGISETAFMRHEWKNRVSSLRLLAEQGDIEGLRQSLAQLDIQLERLAPTVFSENFTVNVILQSAAAKAGDAGVRFTASAPLLEKLEVDSADLCSLLINLLDNAVRAASAAPEGRRRVDIGLKVSQGFLAIKCENTYAGPLPLNRDGTPSVPPLPGHGYGLPQMRLTAKKYGGILDISWTADTFTAQTALNLRQS